MKKALILAGVVVCLAPFVDVNAQNVDRDHFGSSDSDTKIIGDFNLLAFGKDDRTLYVTDLGLGTVVSVPVQKDGTAGSVTSFATVPQPDGIAFDVKGEMYVTSPLTNSIDLVAPNGSVHQLSLDMTRESLNNPSNLAFSGRQLYVTNLGLAGNPGISVVTVQFPGLSLKA